MPVRKVTDPSVLQQLNAGGSVVAPNPMFPGQMQGQQLQNQHTAVETQQGQATLPYAAPKAAAETANAQTTAGVNAATAPAEIINKQGTAQQSQAQGQAAQTNLAVSGGADNSQAKNAGFYNSALKSNKLFEGTGINDDPQSHEVARSLLPQGLVNAFTSSPRQQAETARDDFIRATLRLESGAAIGKEEYERQSRIFFPQPGDAPETVAMKAQLRQNEIEGLRLSAGPAAPKVENGTAGADVPTPPGFQQATGKTQSIVDPSLRALGGKVGAMLARGVPDAAILNTLKQSGVDPANTNVNEALRFRQTKDFRAWQKANPGKAYPIGSDFYTKEVPMSAARSLFNKTAATDVGGDVAAGLVSSANAISGGRLPSMIGSSNGDPQMAQMGMDMLRQNHPLSSVAGDVAGQASVEALLGRIPGASNLMATRYGRRGADALYGTYSGSGENGDNPVSGGIEGAISNTLGGMAGRGLQGAGGRVFSGVKNAHLQYLDNRGIPLTLGQIARGSDNVVGRAVGGIEERLAGLPVADAIINTARKRGDEGFNHVMFDQIAPGVKATGAEGLAQARKAEQDAYAKLNPVRMPVDHDFEAGLSAVEQQAKGLNHHAADVQTVIDDVRSQVANGEITGKGYQTALQAIRKTEATLNDDVGGKASDALDALESQVMALGERQGGDVGKDLAAANAIHSRIKIAQRALKQSVSQSNDELVSPKTLNQASIVNTEKFGGIDRALSPDRPFYDLTDAGKSVMPNLTPDSGTAGRAFLLSALFGGGIGGGAGFLGSDKGEGEGGAMSGAAKGLSLAALLAAPYSKPGQKIIQKMLLGDRNKNIVRLGDLLINNTKGAGLVGSALARRATIQP